MKDQPKHTPGPWKVTRNNMGVRSIDAPVCRLWMLRSGQGVANAHLIAAAPDLLEVLKALTTNPHVNLGDLVYKIRDSECDGWDGPQVKAWSDAVQAAAAAIAKAEGRSE